VRVLFLMNQRFFQSHVVIGQCVTITGFQRKLILVGTEKNEHFLFVATKHSLVSQLSPLGHVPMDCGGKEPYFRAREMIQPLVESQEQLNYSQGISI